jgi:hypothetical protein
MSREGYDQLQRELNYFTKTKNENGIQFFENKQHEINMQMAVCVVQSDKPLEYLLAKMILLYEEHSKDHKNSLLSKWDKRMRETKVLEANAEGVVIHTTYKSPLKPMKSRDFVFRGKKFVESNKITFVMQSIPHPQSVTKNFVRGEIKLNSWIFERVSPTAVLFTYVIHVDPSGKVPAALVNATANERLKWVHHMQRYLQQ